MSSSPLMDGKVVVVTGSGRGIGRDIALQMAAAGARVVVNDTGASLSGEASGERPADEVVGLIRERGGEAAACSDSVAEWNSAQKIVQAALDHFGRIDAVVNNAGILRDRMIFRMSPEEWDAVIQVHLYGSFNVSRAASNHFKEQNGGAYVHMTSTSGLIGSVGQANYSAAKLGIAGLSRSIALDMERYGVRSNCIAPFAWSRMVGSIPERPDEKNRLDMAKMLKTDKIAPLAVFLASDAASETSGQIFAVRGNEIFLMSQPRPVRSMHHADGWTADTLAERLQGAFKASYTPLERTNAVFSWDPI